MNPAPIPLLHGHSIPRLGLGTWPLKGDAVHEMVALALDNFFTRLLKRRRVEEAIAT